MMNYELLLFDVDDTLFDFKQSEKIAFTKTLSPYLSSDDASSYYTLYHQINKALWKRFEIGELTQDYIKIERFRQLADAINIQVNPEAFAHEYMTNLSYASILYDETESLLDTLSKSHRLAIITNGLTMVQTRRVRQSVVAHYFETIVISEEIGLSKPQPDIFSHTLSLIDPVKKSKILMIGDGLSSDILGGNNFGIDTCWYNPLSKPNTTKAVPTYEIQSLFDLYTIV